MAGTAIHKVIHRIGPRCSGISMREHPKPSLQSLRDIVAHYEELASGDYTSLSTRYLYLMSREVIFVLDSLERGGVLLVPPP